MSSSWQLMRPFGSYTSSTGDTILLLPEAPAMLLRWRALFLLLLLLPSCGSAQSCRADTGRAHGPRLLIFRTIV